jgi:outer membrane lipopolysaccharide assembly protein LptE/RlpB
MTLNWRRGAGAVLLEILGVALLVLSGCGYALVGRGSNLPADIKNVYIRPLENRTPRSQVEQALTRAIAEELVQRQRFAVLGGPEGADAELSGAVISYGATPVTFDQSGRATEYEIALTAQIAFKRIGQDQPIWSNDRYTFRETYPIEATNESYVDLEDDAIERAAERFAETMVSDLLEGF